MKTNFERLNVYLEYLKKFSVVETKDLNGWIYKQCGYKHANEVPVPNDSWLPFEGSYRGQYQHLWLYKKVYLPENFIGKNLFFIQLRTDRFKEIYSNSMFLLNKLSEEEKTLLIKNGFLLEDSIDQQAVIITGKHHARLQKNSYHMIINPTLDCNLSCWYCYESHIANSRLNDELVEAICKHIEFKYKEDSIKFLHLSFFGGEPLIASKEICTILNFACSFCSKFDIELNIYCCQFRGICQRNLIKKDLVALNNTFIINNNSYTWMYLVNNLNRNQVCNSK